MPKTTWLTPNAALASREEINEKLEDTCWKGVRLNLDKRLNYFDRETKYDDLRQYDLFFQFTKAYPLWDQRKQRENRGYLPDIWKRINQQEKDRPVPSLTSMNYGRPCRQPYDFPENAYRRWMATRDFTRKKGVMKVEERKPM